MTWITLTGVLSLLAIAAQAQEAPELTLEPPAPNGEYMAGTSLTIKCKIKTQVLDLLIIGREEGDDFVKISTNTFLESKFQDTGRYTETEAESVDEQYREDLIEITDLRGEDSGLIVCQHSLLDQSVSQTSQAIKVLVPVKGVEILQYNEGDATPIQEGDSLYFVEGADHGLICRVAIEGTQTLPTVSITLGDRDITSEFSMEEEPMSSVNGGLTLYENTLLYEHFTATPDTESHGQTLTCTATAQGYEPVSRSVSVEIRYGPRLTCDPAVVAIGDQAEVRCRGQLNPGLELFSIFWDRNPDQNILNLDEKNKGRHHLSFEENGVDVDFILNIDEVKAEDFGLYVFEVQNDVSSKSIDVQVIEVVPATEPPRTTTPKANVATSTDGAVAAVTSRMTLVTCLAVTVLMMLNLSS